MQQPPITVDGDDREWRGSSATVLHTGAGDVREVLAAHDASYLYLLVTVAEPDVWRSTGVTVGFDVLPGGARLPGGPAATAWPTPLCRSAHAATPDCSRADRTTRNSFTWHERPKRGIAQFTTALADVTRPVGTTAPRALAAPPTRGRR